LVKNSGIISLLIPLVGLPVTIVGHSGPVSGAGVGQNGGGKSAKKSWRESTLEFYTYSIRVKSRRTSKTNMAKELVFT